MGSPRVDVVFCIWQCDKENHGWREGPPVTVLCQSFRSAGRAFTLRLNQFERKQEYCLVLFPATPTQNIGRFKSVIHSESADMSQLVVIYRWSTAGGRDRQSALAGLITEFRAYGDNQELAPSTDTMLVGLRNASANTQARRRSIFTEAARWPN